MKIEKLSVDENSFKPFAIQITISTEEEARALYAIFNHTDNARLLRDDLGVEITKTIGKEYWCSNLSSDVIANGVTYRQFYVRR